MILDKWLDHIPRERQVRILERHGLVATSQTAENRGEVLLPWRFADGVKLHSLATSNQLRHDGTSASAPTGSRS
ncbi:MAG: hypothetical protein ACTHU0_12285 [Kofleriaceae bacterium]